MENEIIETEEIEEDSVETEEQTEPTVSEINVLASEMGWVDKDKFKGNIDEWVDAKQFVKDAVIINKKQRNIIERMSDEITTMREDFKSTVKHVRDSAKREIEEVRERLETEKEQAILDADPEKVKEIDVKIKKLDEKEDDDITTQSADPVFIKWNANNDWYGNDKRMTRLADAIAKEYEDTGKSLRDILDIVDYEMKTYLKPPEDTKRTKFEVSDVVDNTHRSKGTPYKFTYDKLPREAKVICDRMVKRGDMTRDEYTKEYFEKVEG